MHAPGLRSYTSFVADKALRSAFLRTQATGALAARIGLISCVVDRSCRPSRRWWLTRHRRFRRLCQPGRSADGELHCNRAHGLPQMRKGWRRRCARRWAPIRPPMQFRFWAKRVDRIKLVFWYGTGVVLVAKRPEKGRFLGPMA
jgi:IS66 Orf2 like protein